jgi:ribosomal-protein-alanine N-acetyltransferase
MSKLTLPRTFPFDDPTVPYLVEPMQVADLGQVMQIEKDAFSAPWPASAYRYELTQNDVSTYLVLKVRRPSRMVQEMEEVERSQRNSIATAVERAARLVRRGSVPILAYGGFWTILDEGHISTLAVHPKWRGHGLGEMMLAALIDAAVVGGAREVTLEVRVSNIVAQNLYRKYSFTVVGRRKRYYHDNNEDALLMTLSDAPGSAYQARYVILKEELRARLSDSL